MKSKLNTGELIKKLGLALWRSLSHNLWYKLLSVLIAVILSGYVIAANPTFPRDKLVGDLDINITGHSGLQSRGFALLNDFSTEPLTAKVRVSVPQSSYGSVSVDNVNVTLDLSNIKKTGVQSVKLRATTTFGTVAQILPESVEVEIEPHDQRVVMVNVQWSGERDEDNFWYNVSRVNPSTITVSGPQSLVQRASTAIVTLDVNGRTEPFAPVEPVGILDGQGNRLPFILNQSASSVSLYVDIYPAKLLPVAVDINEIFTGELPVGFKIDGDIEVQPKQIKVAADQALLDSLSSISILPVDLSGAKRSFNRNTSINKLSDVKYYSSENVNVQVDIAEKDANKTFSNVSATLTNVDPNLRAKWGNPKLVVKVNGPYSIVQDLVRADLWATVDLSEITQPGSYDLPIQVSIDNYPELGYSISPSVAKVTITAN